MNDTRLFTRTGEKLLNLQSFANHFHNANLCSCPNLTTGRWSVVVKWLIPAAITVFA